MVGWVGWVELAVSINDNGSAGAPRTLDEPKAVGEAVWRKRRRGSRRRNKCSLVTFILSN